MNIIVIKPYASVIYNGGVQAQARMWKTELEELGHNVIFFDNWTNTDWAKVDIVLFMCYGKLLVDYLNLLKAYENIRFYIAPIIDYNGRMWQFKLRSRYYGSVTLRWRKELHDFYVSRKQIDGFLVRSEHEKRFLTEGFAMGDEKIHIVPLSYRIKEPSVDKSKKENFCLHVSRLSSPGKNVNRLIEAAKKYGFNLKLAGELKGEKEREWMKNAIKEYSNIEYVGRPTDKELAELYHRARVFALPSTVEGVGMVAMEAALYGCEVVLTNWGAPKEYYDGQAILVNPLDVDDIGKGIIKALNGFAQPCLKKFIEENYNEKRCSKLLEKALLNKVQHN